MPPLVTVMMPAHNADKYIEGAMQSILAQSFRDFELLVVDDNSTDGTRRAAEELARKDRRVRVISGNGICSANARNLALQHARGKYTINMDADDIARKDRVEKQLAECRKHPSAVVGCNVAIVNNKEQPVREVRYPPGNAGIRAGFARRYNRHVIMPGTIMAPTALLKATGYNEGFRILTDWDLILRIADDSSVVFSNVPEFLYLYRLNTGSMSLNCYTRNKYNIMVWYNEFQRKKGLSEAKDLEDFEKRMRKNPGGYLFYWLLLLAKFAQHGLWIWRTKRLLKQ